MSPTVSDVNTPTIAASMSDEALLMSYRDTGDRASLETLIRRYQSELFSFLATLSGRRLFS